MIENSKYDSFRWSVWRFINMQILLSSLFHSLKNNVFCLTNNASYEETYGFNNKETSTCIYAHMCAYSHTHIHKMQAYNTHMCSLDLSELHCTKCNYIYRMMARKVQDNRVNTNISTEWQEWQPEILKTKRHEMYSQNTNDMWV